MYTQPRPGCAIPKLLPEKLIEKLVCLRIEASGLINVSDSLEGMKNLDGQIQAKGNTNQNFCLSAEVMTVGHLDKAKN